MVLDTNVYLSAILFGGKPEQILNLAKEGRITLLLSGAILSEITEVLQRKFGWTSWRIQPVVEVLLEMTTWVVPSQEIHEIQEDEADNHVLACAVEGEADYLVSGDRRHLLPLGEYQGIPILSPAQFLERVSS